MNQAIAKVLLHARRNRKWVPVKYLVRHGLHSSLLIKLEDRGIVRVMKNLELGLCIRLTKEGEEVIESILNEG